MINKFNKFIILLRSGAKRYQRDLFVVFFMLISAGIGYNLGHINSGRVEANLSLQEAGPGSPLANSLAPKATPSDPRVVASKTSKSKLYHYTWCSGAQRIKDTNKIWFNSAAAAEAAGYTLAGNCNP